MTAAVIDFSDYITDRTRDFTGREWVLAEIERWLADPKGPPFFIITGEPGIGKSAIAARLTQVRELAAYHFCIARRADTIDPALLARSLSLQLCQIDRFALGILKDGNVNLPVTQHVQANYGRVIGAKIENLTVNAPTGSVAFTHAVLQPLKALYAEGYDQQVVLLVDALDEAVQHKGRETIVDLLANAGRLPDQVRFILTSRLERAVLRHFEQQQVPHFLLDAGRPENLDDVRRYVRGQVAASDKLLLQLARQTVTLDVFVERMTAASLGNFLYLVWLMPAITAGSQRFDKLEALPQELDGIYRDFLRTRKIGLDEELFRSRYRGVLGVLAAAQAPLTRDQVGQFGRMSKQEARDILSDIRQFLDPQEVAQERFQLYHQSAIDFLTDEQRAEEFYGGG